MCLWADWLMLAGVILIFQLRPRCYFKECILLHSTLFRSHIEQLNLWSDGSERKHSKCTDSLAPTTSRPRGGGSYPMSALDEPQSTRTLCSPRYSESYLPWQVSTSQSGDILYMTATFSHQRERDTVCDLARNSSKDALFDYNFNGLTVFKTCINPDLEWADRTARAF